MAHTVILKRSAEKELDRLPVELHERITRKLLELENNPRPHGVQKLHGENRYRNLLESCSVSSALLPESQREADASSFSTARLSHSSTDCRFLLISLSRFLAK